MFNFFWLFLMMPMASSAMVKLREEVFGIYREETVKKFTWMAPNGFSISAISYGAIIQSIQVPDRHGVIKDVVLGFDDLESYINRNSPHFGSTVGRCANRIAYGTFFIDNVEYEVSRNLDNRHHLHGGFVGFDKVNWNTNVDGNKVTFSYLSKDGEEGYPGDLLTNMSIEVFEDWSVNIIFQSTTTKKTVVNLTNHAYFNLAGHETGAVELFNHHIMINADAVTKVNEDNIPTGDFVPVEDSPYDLRLTTRIGDIMESGANLFDDNYCVSFHDENEELKFVARVAHPQSGRYLELYSDQPGVQFYTSNFLPDHDEPAILGKDYERYRKHGAFCLETQNFPDAVNHLNFPSPILSPGDFYSHRVVYSFGVKK